MPDAETTDQVTRPAVDLSHELADLEHRLTRLRDTSGPESADDTLLARGELDIAFEELRVADEELRAQHAQIEALLGRHRDDRLWRERMSALLPMAVLVTDLDGLTVEANAAAALLLRRRVQQLIRKPLASFVIDVDRPVLRTALTRLRAMDEQQLSLRVNPEGGAPVETSAVGLAETVDEQRAVRWVFLPAPLDAPAAGQLRDVRVDDLATASAFAELCRVPLQEQDRTPLLVHMAELVQQALPEADSVSLTLGSPTDPECSGAESSLARQLDELQHRTGEGPCNDAYNLRDTVVTDDLLSDRRWPKLANQTSTLPVRSVIAVPISAGGDHLGVINAYAGATAAFGRRGIRVAEMAGGAVSSVLSEVHDLGEARELSRHLQHALESRAVIDQAKGIIMAKYGGTSEEAFQRLSAISQRSNVKLREVAGLLVKEATDRGSHHHDRRPGTPKPRPPAT